MSEIIFWLHVVLHKLFHPIQLLQHGNEHSTKSGENLKLEQNKGLSLNYSKVISTIFEPFVNFHGMSTQQRILQMSKTLL